MNRVRLTSWSGAVALLTLIAAGLRLWRLGDVPPGWRDDELSNVFALTAQVLAGAPRLYYVDASGQEGLYYWLSAVAETLFGRTPLGIRGVSVFFGVLTIPLTYLVGRWLLDRRAGFLAAAMLAVSFWSLMYSRFGLRQILMPAFWLATVASLWYGLYRAEEKRAGRYLALAGFWMGIGFYTYFAARGAPLIVLIWLGYLAWHDRARLRARWRGLALMAVVTFIMALPLWLTLQQLPAADARIAEVAKPLTAALAGDYAPLREHVIRTLSMFHRDGDAEDLYNIPFRPLFNGPGAALLWLGVGLAVVGALAGWRRGTPHEQRGAYRPAAWALLLIWWGAGLAPAFISVPPASLGHTIAAQPATYLLAAAPIAWLTRRRRWVGVALAGLAVTNVAARDLPDYFVVWPAGGNTRFLYRADIADVADYLSANPALTDFGITGLLAGPWDRLALELDAPAHSIHPRWFNPTRAVLLVMGGRPALTFQGYPQMTTVFDEAYAPVALATAGAYTLKPISLDWQASLNHCFSNGLCLVDVAYQPLTGGVDVTWRVAQALDLPAQPIVSFPPPPGVYAGPRLAAFVHLWDAAGGYLTGDDGLWVDPLTLQAGDVFRQRHNLTLPAGTVAETLAIGLYDPLTAQRLLTLQGLDHVALPAAGPATPGGAP